MIKGIGFENFKSFQNLAYIDFKKINVLLGPNSSGKSSYMKGLLTLQNTMKSKEEQPALYLNERIGDFRSITYGLKPDGMVTYVFHFGEDHSKKSQSFELKEMRNRMAHGFSKMAAFGLVLMGILLAASQYKSTQVKESGPREQRLAKYLKAYEKYTESRLVKITFSVREQTLKKPNILESMKLEFDDQDVYEIVLKGDSYEVSFNHKPLPRASDWFLPYKFFLRVNEKYMDLDDIVETDDLHHIVTLSLAMLEFEQSVRDLTGDMIHIEPFRNEPKRSEMITNFTFGSVGPKGENMLTSIIGMNSSQDEKDQKNSELRAEINRWMDEFNLAESVDVEELGNNNYSLSIKNKYTKIMSNIADVGVGTSQLLPIIIESVLSPKNSTLLIEEPETHIHPNAQAKLGELFVSCSEKYDKRFFIETHSMYLLIQLQILVAKKELKPEDIGVYYFLQDENGTHIKDLRIDEHGQFEEDFPDGFFDVAFKLTTTLLENM